MKNTYVSNKKHGINSNEDDRYGRVSSIHTIRTSYFLMLFLFDVIDLSYWCNRIFLVLALFYDKTHFVYHLIQRSTELTQWLATNKHSDSVHAYVCHSIVIVVVYSIISYSNPIGKSTSVTIVNAIIVLVKYTRIIIINNFYSIF